jgi:hypothetical protein
LNLFLWFLFDGIQLNSNVINVYVTILLYYPHAQLCLVNTSRIQFLEPLFDSSSYIQFANLEQFANIQIFDFNCHS